MLSCSRILELANGRADAWRELEHTIADVFRENVTASELDVSLDPFDWLWSLAVDVVALGSFGPSSASTPVSSAHRQLLRRRGRENYDAAVGACVGDTVHVLRGRARVRRDAIVEANAPSPTT